MAYNSHGKRISSENLAGQVTTTAWDCCHKVSETQPDGSTTTWDYDDEGRMIAYSRLIPLDMTNVTWLTTCYEYDDLGRQTATWQTNYAAQVGLPVMRTRYDQLGRVVARVDQLGNTTSTTYSPDGRTVFVQHPNTSTTTYTRSPFGDTLSITGSAVTPEFHTYGILPDGTRWSRTIQGETANSPRFTKRYENLLGQTIREERSGFHGAVLATTHTYDSLGRLVSTSADYEPTIEYSYDLLGNRTATTRVVGMAGAHASSDIASQCSLRSGDVRTPPCRATEWRKAEAISSFVLDDTIVWLIQTNIASCSDSAIAPLVSSSARQLTGLMAEIPLRSRTTDVRGKVTENEMLLDSSVLATRQALPYATNKSLSFSRYGVSLMTVSVSAVTNAIAYDALGRLIANTDGRGNIRHLEYNVLGQRSASIDALGNRKTYGYDKFGNLSSVTDALGNVMIYEYDLRGRRTYEGGSTYPVRYTYDVFGNKITMVTYRNESSGRNSGDATTWLYDEASGLMTNKIYASGKGPAYHYTPDGKLAQRIWARGIVTDYFYDNWGSLTNTIYSDDTPSISITYNAMGRQIEVLDAAGITTFLYNSFGSLTNEIVVGVAGTNTIFRHWDNFGRDTGYSLNGTRQSTLVYDSATGRLATMLAVGSETPFVWSYLAGSDLKSSLTYPNGITASWQYDSNNQLLQVCNATSTNIISRYDYVYDAAGRRVNASKFGTAVDQDDTISYHYNVRSELTNATSMVDIAYRYACVFDDIGNREISRERGTNFIYTANQLNQYSVVDDFTPEYDDDGNQILIKTSTGVWSVSYNGENRPTHWTNGETTVVMGYDHLGRRVAKNDQNFVYNRYLQIANYQPSSGLSQFFVWDPNEVRATRPLVWNRCCSPSYYIHDGIKNVSEVVSRDGTVIAHYEFAPFGGETVRCGDSALENPWRFSSEYADDDVAMVYFIYRHYDARQGRWIGRDPIGELGGVGEYLFIRNQLFQEFDRLGLLSSSQIQGLINKIRECNESDDVLNWDAALEALYKYAFGKNWRKLLSNLLKKGAVGAKDLFDKGTMPFAAYENAKDFLDWAYPDGAPEGLLEKLQGMTPAEYTKYIDAFDKLFDWITVVGVAVSADEATIDDFSTFLDAWLDISNIGGILGGSIFSKYYELMMEGIKEGLKKMYSLMDNEIYDWFINANCCELGTLPLIFRRSENGVLGKIQEALNLPNDSNPKKGNSNSKEEK